MIKSALACFAFWLMVSLIFVNQVYGYSRITNVEVYAPFEAKVGEEVPVHAHIHTGNNKIESVHDVEALLILPPNVSLTSGTNPIFIGEMGPGPADAWIRDWTVIFEQPGTYTIVINASCIDTQYVPRWMTNSTTVDAYNYPHVEFFWEPSTEIFVNQTITFNATKSHAQGPGREIVLYQWDFGEEANATMESPITQHTYRMTGNFQVSLKVTDNKNLTSIATANITINLRGDLNMDGKVNIEDLFIVAHAYGSTPENER